VAHLVPFCLIASILGAIFVMVAAVVLPAGRIRSVFFFLSLFLLFFSSSPFECQAGAVCPSESNAFSMLYLKPWSLLIPWLLTT
jgi:predicted membrane channel-forming protein YqfA (hemolysin III family)